MSIDSISFTPYSTERKGVVDMRKSKVITVSLVWSDRNSPRHIKESADIRAVIARFASVAHRDDARIVFHLDNGGTIVLEADGDEYFLSARMQRSVQS